MAAEREARPGARRGRPRSKAATAAVLDAAYDLVVREGLRGASIEAIAAASGVSKVTIYKRWEDRLALLTDAFLRQVGRQLPLAEGDDPVGAIRTHAARYVEELRGDLGKALRAVLAEGLAKTGDAAVFRERYLARRRALGARVIAAGQRSGAIRADRPALALYDQIYGTIFYRFLFGLPGLNGASVRALIDGTFGAPAPRA